MGQLFRKSFILDGWKDYEYPYPIMYPYPYPIIYPKFQEELHDHSQPAITCSKLLTIAIGVVLVSLSLTLNTFCTLFYVSIVIFEDVITSWERNTIKIQTVGG